MKQTCNKCGTEYFLTREFFGQTKQKSGKIDFRKVCRKCMAANTRRHYMESPEKVQARSARRKQLDEKAIGAHAESDLTLIRQALGNRCRYCGVQLGDGGEFDHITPIARGGSNWAENLTLACLKCNKEKRERTLDEYLQWRRERGLPIRQLP